MAFLRGIGPGNPKMRNEQMVRVLERAGLADVRSVISSGNYVFRAEQGVRARSLEDRIEPVLADHLGHACTAIVRSRRQLERIARLGLFEGWDDAPDARCNVTFLKRRPLRGAQIPAGGDGYEVLALRNQCVFFVVDTTRSKTPDVMSLMERTFGKKITTRTWQTVHRTLRAFTD